MNERFAQALVKAKAGQLNILSEDSDGLITHFIALCSEQLELLTQELDQEESVGDWVLERNTWSLLRSLYTERLSEPFASSSTCKNPFNPAFNVVQRIVGNSKDLTELSLVRDWLSSITSTSNLIETRNGYYPFTKNSLKQQRRLGKEPATIKSLDPDATFRQGKPLLVEDALYERALLHSLYLYVRAGDLPLALDLCRKSDQSWRAASLAGGNFWQDPAISNSKLSSGYDEDMEDSGSNGESRAKGNRRRSLWKTMCGKLSSNTTLDPYERALYGSISGDITSVLPVCEGWEDHLWARVNSLLESAIDQELASAHLAGEGCFYPRPTSDDVNQTKDIRNELESIFEVLARKGSVGETTEAFHDTQRGLILAQVSELIQNAAAGLEGFEGGEAKLANLLRFYTNLILTLRALNVSGVGKDDDIDIYGNAGERIIEGYLKVLQGQVEDESLIAFYASQLRDDRAVESYASFLCSFSPSSTKDSRRIALTKAQEAGLDCQRIAARVVEILLGGLLEESSPTEPTATLNLNDNLSSEDVSLIRGVEWLTFDQNCWTMAIRWTNLVGRWFLASVKPHATRSLLLSLPIDLLPHLATVASAPRADSTNTSELIILQEEIKEALDVTAFFECLEKHSNYSEVWSQKARTGSSKTDAPDFRDGIATLVDNFYASAIELLESDWLKFDVQEDGIAGIRKSQELSKIRKIYIPELIFRLHFTLIETSSIIPTNLTRALALSNIVADEKYSLYLEFITPERNRIGEYLLAVREAKLKAVGPKL